jgi:hypothetical protein
VLSIAVMTPERLPENADNRNGGHNHTYLNSIIISGFQIQDQKSKQRAETRPKKPLKSSEAYIVSIEYLFQKQIPRTM